MLEILTLAQTAAPDPQISGAWALKLVAGIFSGLGVLVAAAWAAYKKGQGNPISETTIRPPLPEVTTREAPVWVAQKDFDDLKEDIDKGFSELKLAMAEE